VLGLTVQTLNKELAEKLNLTDTEGVVVAQVAAGSPAEKAGIQHGDLITEVKRQPVRTVEQFRAAIKKASLKEGLLIYLKRDGQSSFVVLKEK
jgi:serine protease Do